MSAEPRQDKSNPPKSWLKYVSEQSWEPELLISGLAIYASLNLPGVFTYAYEYYKFNLQTGSGIFDDVLPLLVYGMLITSSYILAAAFITHFVIRAFWVGFIGLISVFEDGVRYENLPYSDLFNEKMKSELGDSNSMAARLDNISSLVYSIAFTLVLIMVAVSIIYMVFFLLYNGLKLFIDQATFDAYAGVVYGAVVVIMMAYAAALLVLNMKRFRSQPKYARMHLNLSFRANKIILPLVYRPLQFIQLTFLSNVSPARFSAYYGVLVVCFFAVFTFVSLKLAAPDFFDTRDFYATRASASHIETHEYSSNLREGDFIHSAALESDVISSDMMQLFIPYPKQLDEIFSRSCSRPELSDELSKYEKRPLINEHRINCAEQHFSFALNDSVTAKTDLFFTEHAVTGQKGFVSMVDVSMLGDGIHQIKLNRLSVTAADSTRIEDGRMLTYEAVIPFWISR
jgi:hypothetical protein